MSEAYAELQTVSNFSFLTGASHPEELVQSAALLGHAAIAITDLSSLAGIVRAHAAAKEHGVRFVVGCSLELELPEGRAMRCLLYPTDRASYGRLCRLLTLAKTGSLEARTDGERWRAGQPAALRLEDLLSLQKDLAVIACPHPAFLAGRRRIFEAACGALRDACGEGAFHVAVHRHFEAHGEALLDLSLSTARSLGCRIVATNDVHYHTLLRRPLQDVLTCIRNGCSITEAGFLLHGNGERRLKSPREMARVFRDLPEALRATLEIADRCSGFSLDQLRYEYPGEVCPPGMTPLEYLTHLTYEGARERYPDGIPDRVLESIRDELALIRELDYEQYFLTCHDIVRFARGRGILCQGRGAAANSTVCFCLGITSVDPSRIDLLFARFVSKERNEPPDIDIDFEHERREEIIQYIYGKYGREHAGLTCEVVTYRQRSAVRDVGKALGLSSDVVDKLAKSLHRWTGCELTDEDCREIGISRDDPLLGRVLGLANELLGFPRHLSQHVGGFIICRHPLCESVPILNARMEDRTIIEWDKDDIEALGMLKIDVLGLGMLTCIRKALEMLRSRRAGGEPAIELHDIPSEDPRVYDMICEADTIGVFQIESRAQMSMLPRLKPRCFYDLVIEVAIVRPGPIQGNMVHPYLRRRMGLERMEYPDETVKEILGKTLGVPLFQEQAMRLAIALADFTPGEAEQLRRAIVAWKRKEGLIARFTEKVISGMMQRGYSREFAELCMTQIRGFSSYGFPESHAASFALLVYVSAWIKCHHPAVFAAALLNSQPMGFYAPSQILSDAARHGVEIRPALLNESLWDCTLEGAPPALRLGFRQIKGVSEAQIETITSERENGRYSSLQDLWARAKPRGLSRKTLLCLARADAFADLSLSRREAIWEILSLPADHRPLDRYEGGRSAVPALPALSRQQEMFHDYSATGLSLRAHPLSFARTELKARGALSIGDLADARLRGKRVSAAGIGIIRQRPGTAKGVVFLSLEDETGIANLLIRPQRFERYKRIIMASACMLATGKLEHVGKKLPYIEVESLESLDDIVLRSSDCPLPNRSYSY